jgi:hypothetical protein
MWNLVGPNGASDAKKDVDRLLPNCDVMARDCLLVHARSLIKFYRNSSRRSTDIILSDFGVPAVDVSLSDRLERFEYSIEVHLLHLTDWRDSDYRRLNARVATPSEIVWIGIVMRPRLWTQSSLR